MRAATSATAAASRSTTYSCCSAVICGNIGRLRMRGASASATGKSPRAVARARRRPAEVQRHRVVDAGLHAVGRQASRARRRGRRPARRRGGTRAPRRRARRRASTPSTAASSSSYRARRGVDAPRSTPSRCGSFGEQEAGLQVVQTVAVADDLVHGLGRARRGCAAAAPCGPRSSSLRRHGSAVAQRAEVLARVEAEGGRDAHRAARPALEARRRAPGRRPRPPPARAARRSARCSPCRPAARRGARAGWPPCAG